MAFLPDCNDEQIEVGYSHGRVMAVAVYGRNLIRNGTTVWPPAAILQKLYNSRHAYAYAGEALEIVARRLQYHCDLQSIHSDDNITWSFFGPLMYLPAQDQASALNWMLNRIGLDGQNTRCELSLWRRVPHWESLVPGGPEIDFLLTGNRDVVMGEAKWRSVIGAGQGVNRDRNQV